MSMFDDKYDIRFAKELEIPDIMNFIDSEWKEGHILGNNIEFFRYEHVINDKVTFVIAKEKINNSIEGILGYIPSSNEGNSDVWTGIWKVRKGAPAFLGMELMKRLTEMTQARALIGVGDNPDTTIKLFKLMKMNHCIVLLKQYYRLNDDLRDCRLVRKTNTNKQIEWHGKKNCHEIVIKKMNSIKDVLDSIDLEKYRHNVPYKDGWYINHRYFEHPIYNYSVYLIKKNRNASGEDGALMVMRKDGFEDRFAMRIVDYIGNQELFSYTYDFWREILSDRKIEYIDMYEYGFEEEHLISAGFQERKGDDCIIPNYYHPFEKRNVEIWCDSSEQNTLFFKGDGDQDRPN